MVPTAPQGASRMTAEWNPAEDGLANCMRRAALRPLGDLIRETDPETFKDQPVEKSPVGTITDIALMECLIESRNVGSPRYLASKKTRIERARVKTFTDHQLAKGEEILARINRRKTA